MDSVDTINQINFFAFTILLILGAARTLLRFIRFKRYGERMPRLLKRDVLWQGLFSFTMLLVFTGRILDHTAYLITQAWWVMLTGLPAVLAVGVYAYYEFFVIERH